MRKLLTIVIPSYNSASYLEPCVHSAAQCGDELDVLIIDDGSTDETPRIADGLAQRFPGVVRVIHQENGGHGEGLNQGIRCGEGLFIKSLDSDDRLEPSALKSLLEILRRLADAGTLPDLIVNDYVYDRPGNPACFSVSYHRQLKENTLMTWDTVHAFPMWKQFMIHSLTYRTGLLREMNLVLPKHTFYEDNLYIYQPLPHVKTLYYLRQPLYRYFIGREDQSVNDKVIVKRLDQVSRIACQMITSYSMEALSALPVKLKKYMLNNLAGQLFTTSSLQYMSGETGLKYNREMWEQVRAFDPALYRALRNHPLGRFTVLPGRAGRQMLVTAYRAGRKMIQF